MTENAKTTSLAFFTISFFVLSCHGFLDQPAYAQKPKTISILENSEAWKYLPPVEKWAGQPLPAWARALARTLPRTTAALLELDYSHRVKSPLDPKLRGMMRWMAAHTNHCAYTEAIAA